jgi:hypothetical protein
LIIKANLTEKMFLKMKITKMKKIVEIVVINDPNVAIAFQAE